MLKKIASDLDGSEALKFLFIAVLIKILFHIGSMERSIYGDLRKAERQCHYAPLCSEVLRSDRYGHQREEYYQTVLHFRLGLFCACLSVKMGSWWILFGQWDSD